jgi:hypothetical protein
MPETLTLAEGTALPASPAVARLCGALTGATQSAHIAGLGTSAATACLLETAPGDIGPRLGRYAGALELDGRAFVLEPRIGWDTLNGWVAAATGLPVPRAAHEGAHARVAALTAMLWVRAVDDASRHGPPSFRRDVAHVGGSVRGRLDVRRTVRLRAKGASAVASVYRTRELDNPVTRIIVAADRVLERELGSGRWHTDRVEQVLAQLHTAVGRRIPVPGDGELHRMRYTPITRPFKWAAELSSRIVRQDPLATTPLRGRVQGLVLDLDGIYAEATLGWARAARPDLGADKDDRGRIVLRDRRAIFATIELMDEAAASGAPVLELTVPGATPERLALPSEPAAAALTLRQVLHADISRASRQVPAFPAVPRS